jgi:hypothetical protein
MIEKQKSAENCCTALLYECTATILPDVRILYYCTNLQLWLLLYSLPLSLNRPAVQPTSFSKSPRCTACLFFWIALLSRSLLAAQPIWKKLCLNSLYWPVFILLAKTLIYQISNLSVRFTVEINPSLTLNHKCMKYTLLYSIAKYKTFHCLLKWITK